MRKIILLFLIMLPYFIVSSYCMAQEKNSKNRELTIYMRVKDHLTHDDIDSTLTARLLLSKDSSFVDSATISKTNYQGQRFTYAQAVLKDAGNYLMEIKAKGYADKYVAVDIPKLYKNEQFRELKPAYLRIKPRSHEVELGEVVVKATKLKFYMDGDTLVYNADAFNLSEGSMLSSLIKKLPGVELKEGGEITVNGQRVESMLLNGKDFMDADRELLLENMPAYMVKKIKSYERTPLALRGTNQEKAVPKELVLDIDLKRDYHTGWMANAAGGAGSNLYDSDEDRDAKFMGRLFGLRFSDKSRLLLYGNANNLNDDHSPGDNGDWSALSQTEGKKKIYSSGASYTVGSVDHIRYYGSVHPSYQEKDEANNSLTEQFLQNGNTFGRSFYGKKSYDFSVYSNHEFIYRTTQPSRWYKNIYFNFKPQLYFLNYSNNIRSGFATFTENAFSKSGKEWIDSISAPNTGSLLRQYALNRSVSKNLSKGHWLDTSGDFNFVYTPAHNDMIDLYISGHYQIKDNANEGNEDYLLDYPCSQSLSTRQKRYMPHSNQTQEVNIISQLPIRLTKNPKLLQYVIPYVKFGYSHQKSNNPLFINTDKDSMNSIFSNTLTKHCTPGISYNLTKIGEDNKMSRLAISLLAPHYHERMNHIQQQDTTVARSSHLFQPVVSFLHVYAKRGRRIEANYSMINSIPSVSYLVPTVNSIDPLNLRYTNPLLKNGQEHTLSASYKDKYGSSTLFNSSLNVVITENAVAQSFIYDYLSGKKEIKPENVNGNWNMQFGSGIDFALDKAEKWRLKENASYQYVHSVDIINKERSVVGSNYLNNQLQLTFRPSDKMDFSAITNLHYTHSTSERSEFSTINAFDFDYGCTAQVELPWQMKLSTDITMYSRRGYNDSSMNTNELVWNARLTKSIMHGNLRINLDALDILGNLTNVRRSIDAQGRTETYYNIIPSYTLLHIAWRFNQ
ncbi:MAG: outer membrane beta-barrel family protein [Bacteroidaceae bacterium]|nr:outer membrane beta-barrel family protein [Bacteroidaceae bacterium]